jgi:hypothetical protein
MKRRICAWIGWIALSACAHCPASWAISPQELQKILQTARGESTSYTETHESPWLNTPSESRGMLRATADMLEKRVESPRRETWKLYADRMELIDSDGRVAKAINLSQAPSMMVLSDTLRAVLSGDMVALLREFTVEIGGSPQAWQASMRPRKAEAARFLERVELNGDGAGLRVLTIIERRGDRITTRIGQ